jgi:hypothetical protein
VSHVLLMAAFKFGHPVSLRILMKTDDPPSHTSPAEILVRVCLTKCASAAGPRARARTNLRFLSGTHGRAPPARCPAPVRPVGCMRGLGGSADSSSAAFGIPPRSDRRRARCRPS